MTGLYSAQLQPALPPWALEGIPDLSQWKWHPPTDAVTRNERKQQPKQRAFVEAISDWVFKPEQAAVDTDAQWHQEVEIPRVDPFLEGLHAIEMSIDELPAAELQPKLETFARSLRQQLLLGLISIENVRLALDIIPERLLKRLTHNKVSDGILFGLYSSILDGMVSSNVVRASSYPADLWNTLLLRSSQLGGSNCILGIFSRVVNAIPEDYIDNVGPGILSVLQTVLSPATFAMDEKQILLVVKREYRLSLSFAARISKRLEQVEKLKNKAVSLRDARRAECLYRARTKLTEVETMTSEFGDSIGRLSASLLPHENVARAVASALQNLSGDAHGDLLAEATDTIMASSRLDGERYTISCLCWLTTLSHMPHISDSFLFTVATKLFKTSTAGELPRRDFCQLMVNKWISQGFFDDPNGPQKAFDAHMLPTQDTSSIASLAHAVCLATVSDGGREIESQRHRLIQSLLSGLQRVGRSDEIVSSFAVVFKQATSMSLDAVKLMAHWSGDHRLAVELYQLCSTHKARLTRPLRAWGWEYWAHYVQAMIEDNMMPPARVWEVLGIAPYQEGRRGAVSRQDDIVPPEKVELIENMAVWFAARPNLHNRVALRNVSVCISYLQDHGMRLSTKILGALAHVITRDLSIEREGRTSRLMWLQSLIRKNHSYDAAKRFGLDLLRWRRLNRILRGGRSLRGDRDFYLSLGRDQSYAGNGAK
jgi:hypothetical protein